LDAKPDTIPAGRTDPRAGRFVLLRKLGKSAALGVLAIVLLGTCPSAAQDHDVTVEEGTRVKIVLPGVERVDLVRGSAEGTYAYHVRFKDGREESLSPDALAEAMFRIQSERPFWQRVLNISTAFGIAWVALGLLGQLLFTGRMLVQWIASEKARRSIVPVSFWWMSLGGATMLILYFIWRKDIVGIFGQSTGWVIYGRNLYLIYHKHAPALQR
jgi:lipid-A-disaccharide synthase-like uncharacterized protein